jgi:peptide-methionine (R)-S-oxide reductase
MPRAFAVALAACVTLAAWLVAFRPGPRSERAGANEKKAVAGVTKTDAEWRRELSPLQYQVLRQRGTERPFTGRYWDHHERGTYRCAGCGAPLFSSAAKFDSGTGWPRFGQPISGDAVATEAEDSLFERRIEVRCRRCGSHLGHVFDAGPRPTGLRYCVNSASLGFEPAPE